MHSADSGIGRSFIFGLVKNFVPATWGPEAVGSMINGFDLLDGVDKVADSSSRPIRLKNLKLLVNGISTNEDGEREIYLPCERSLCVLCSRSLSGSRLYTDIMAEGRDGGIYRGDGRVNVFLDKAGACTAKGVRAVRLCRECPGTSGGLDVVHFHTHAEVVRLPSKRSAPKKRAGVSGADGAREFASHCASALVHQL